MSQPQPLALFRTLQMFTAGLALLGSAAAQCTYSWPASAFGSGTDDSVTALCVRATEWFVGGRFSNVNGVPATRVARFDGASWSALGSGMNADVYALLPLVSGELAAAGAFTTAGGVTVNCVARWNGSTWSGFGNGIDGLLPFGSNVQALAQLPNGDLVVAGSFAAASGVAAANIARWNGTAWSALGTGINGAVRGLAVAANGDLIAIGSFTTAGGVAASSIARWNGTTWSAFGTGLGIFGGDAVAILPNGNVVAGGTFVTAGGVACNRIGQWNGSAWSALGIGMNNAVTSLRVLANGDLLAGGLFTTAGGIACNRLARWNGSAWSAIGTGADGAVHEIAQVADGSVVVGGAFANVGGAANARLARAVSSCAPIAAAFGSGCTGSGGFNTLSAVSWPLVGGTFRAHSTGMPSFGLVLAITGFTTTALPIAALLPQGLPGCTLYASLDLVDASLPVAGSADSSFAIGNSPAFLGASLVHQHAALELDLLGNLTAVSSSNGLQLTVGTF